jgi:hypothetical protein
VAAPPPQTPQLTTTPPPSAGTVQQGKTTQVGQMLCVLRGAAKRHHGRLRPCVCQWGSCVSSIVPCSMRDALLCDQKCTGQEGQVTVHPCCHASNMRAATMGCFELLRSRQLRSASTLGQPTSWDLPCSSTAHLLGSTRAVVQPSPWDAPTPPTQPTLVIRQCPCKPRQH